MVQQGDVKLYNTVDGGEIDIISGVATMDAGLETAVYLSLFGGNRDDPGEFDKKNSWWGNSEELDIKKQYRSKTQYLLQYIPATSSNLLRIKDAVNSDLEWLKNQPGVKSVNTGVSIPSINSIKILVSFEVNGKYYDYNFSEQWGNIN